MVGREGWRSLRASLRILFQSLWNSDWIQARSPKSARSIDQDLNNIRDKPKLVKSFFHANSVVYAKD